MQNANRMSKRRVLFFVRGCFGRRRRNKKNEGIVFLAGCCFLIHFNHSQQQPFTIRNSRKPMESSALDLPETRILLRPHLSLASLRACVLVFKNRHNNFIQFLWATFYFGPPRKTSTTSSSVEHQPPERATIEKYAHFIQDLVVFRLTPTFRLDLFKALHSDP